MFIGRTDAKSVEFSWQLSGCLSLAGMVSLLHTAYIRWTHDCWR